MGPRTGRGFGYCSGYARPGYMTAGPGWGAGRGFSRGFGRGPGLGRGFGRGRGLGRAYGYPWAGAYGWSPYAAPYTYGAPAMGAVPPPIDEEEMLTDEAAALEAELDRVRQRLGELKKGRESQGTKKHEK